LISTIHDEAEASARLDWARVQKVLLVRLRSIGDTVLMTPCLEAIKALRNDIAITVVLEPLSAPILEDHPLVDQLLVTSATFTKRVKLVKSLRRSRFDVAFNLHGGTTASIIAKLSGARDTVGFAGYRYSKLLNRRAPAPDRLLNRSTIHSVEQQLALLQWTGVPFPEARPRLRLTANEAAERAARERLQACGLKPATGSGEESQSRFAIIAPAAAFAAKQWPENRFAEVVNYLSEIWHLPSVIIAGREQVEVATKVAALAKGNAHVLTGLNLKELMALISLSSLFVGNDSGPMHIAAAFCRPVVGIFGPSNPDVWCPWTEAPNRVVAAERQATPRQATAAPDGAARIRRIPADAVIAAVNAVLKEAAVADFKAMAR
jgi:lipopolysaccharide heptosyltransferase II